MSINRRSEALTTHDGAEDDKPAETSPIVSFIDIVEDWRAAAEPANVRRFLADWRNELENEMAPSGDHDALANELLDAPSLLETAIDVASVFDTLKIGILRQFYKTLWAVFSRTHCTGWRYHEPKRLETSIRFNKVLPPETPLILNVSLENYRGNRPNIGILSPNTKAYEQNGTGEHVCLSELSRQLLASACREQDTAFQQND